MILGGVIDSGFKTLGGDVNFFLIIVEKVLLDKDLRIVTSRKLPKTWKQSTLIGI